ncbi:MAG: DUF1887 family protein [Solobacterium sp.]|nr:DUF1887 family protein [Solobacterium sp.]
MKTLIEIYDDDQMLNLLSFYQLNPDRVVFIYTEKQEPLLHNSLIERKIRNTEYILYQDQEPATLLEPYRDDEVYVDIQGGNELTAVKLSRLLGKTVCYSDLDKKKYFLLEGDSQKSADLIMPKLTVREIVELYGGLVRNLPEEYFDDHGRKAVEECMAARRKNSKKWNAFCKTMGSFGTGSHELSVWKADRKFYQDFSAVLAQLDHVFDKVELTGESCFMHFHDTAYQILVTDTGVPFEYETYYQITDSGAFDDVDLRVNIDWNGGTFESGDPNSELDVVASKDSRLISISCKAGKYDQQAIYEVKANADKFGGSRAVPVLCVDIDMERPEYVEKAREIGVLLIEHGQMREKKAAKMILEWMETH